MKVLHVMTSCSESSASYRLHKSLNDIGGVESYSLVLRTHLNKSSIYISKSNGFLSKACRKIDSFFSKSYRERLELPFSSSLVGCSNVIKEIKEINPDIVHLHWINGGFLTIFDLGKIDIPIIYSMHDNWIFTGGCHIKWDCDKYLQNCGKCPLLNSSNENDLSRLIWKTKDKIFSKMNKIIFVGLSKWITKLAKESSLLKDKKIVNLPNGININDFKPINKKRAREKLNILSNKKLIIFGAMNALYDINKGFKELVLALSLLDTDDAELVIFGNKDKKIEVDNIKIHFLGFISDIETMACTYSAADVIVVPSLQENLSNAIMESLSCGTPVVAFDIGGNSDMIDHKKNGYLAKRLDIEDLAKGIEFVLQNTNYDELSKNARKKVINNFESKLVAHRYKELYEEILKNET